MLNYENYNGVYIEKITKIKNVFMQHNYDKERVSFEKTIYKINFDNGDIYELKLEKLEPGRRYFMTGNKFEA